MPVPVRLRRQLIGIADSPLRRWSEEVQSIARMVADNYDDENLRSTFVGLTLQLALEQPLKTPFVAAVVLVANTLKPEIVDAVLEALARETESKIAKGEWREVKLYLKLLACLQACLQDDGVFPLLEELFSRAADLQTASSEDVGVFLLLPLLESFPSCTLLTLYDVDYRHRNCQDHPAHDSLHHGCGSGPVPAEGGRAHGEDRHHRFRTPRASGLGRPVRS